MIGCRAGAARVYSDGYPPLRARAPAVPPGGERPSRAGKSGGQAARLISTGQLKALPLLHLRPIDPVVFREPSVPLVREGDLIFGGAWRLDAFSAYPFAA